MIQAKEQGWAQMTLELGAYQAAVDAALAELETNNVVSRIWAHDHTVWSPEPAEITNRLGWLHIVDKMQDNLPCLVALRETVVQEGYTDVLLMGMGGSSLAPEVFSKVFSNAGGLALHVLDSTDPGYVLHYAAQLDLVKTLFIVATKSGGTAETLSFFKFFYNRIIDAVGIESAGQHFVGITDPGSRLLALGEQFDFRTILINDPNIGGRYSVFSYFGLIAAALAGLDLDLLLERAQALIGFCESEQCVIDGRNAAAALGAIMGVLARQGRDKVTFVTSPALVSFGDWVEQLIAESTGKKGRGILPVVGEPLGAPEVYGLDRIFVQLTLGDDNSGDAELAALAAAGHPIVRLHLRDRYDLAQQFFLWELATAVSGYFLGINPFDQPNVEAAKRISKKMIQAYHDEGVLPETPTIAPTAAALLAFLKQAKAGDYLSLHAYLTPTPETGAALAALQRKLRDHTHLATTIGYGPRFLHSTGQLHKGDSGNGLFIQFLADDSVDAPIPDQAGEPASAMTFGVLKAAQALGDEGALREVDRRLIRFHLGEDVLGGLAQLAALED